MEAMEVTCLQKVDTLLNADSVEWCPHTEMQNILLCGTYKLKETVPEQSSSADEETEALGDAKPQTRDGGVTVFSLTWTDSRPHLDQVGKLETCGVLDIKWPTGGMGEDGAIFAFVDAEGFFQIYRWDGGANELKEVAKEKLSESSLGLSLGWCGSKCGSHVAAASDSAGNLTVFDTSSSIQVLSTWHAHEYEAWITAFHEFDKNILYSGGDDCRLKGWDLRDTSRPIFLSRRHQMGVCSIQSHPFDENIFASGSYDEELLIWDRRNLKQPLASTSLGGGIWRIKWDPFDGSKILTATMYAGTHIVTVDCQLLKGESESPLPIVASYDDHNLAYGADWCRLNSNGTSHTASSHEKGKEIPESYLVTTCSFYDHSLHLWEWKELLAKSK